MISLLYLPKNMLKIKLADINDISSIASFCHGSLLGTKIMCQINAYGLEREFLSVWCCVNNTEEIFAVISKFEDNVTVKCIPECSFEDLSTFISMVGFGTLCCTEETAHKLKFTVSDTKKAYKYKGDYNGDFFCELNENHYKACYSLICENIPGAFIDSEEAYLSFLSDFTFRKRRGMARIKGYTENGKLFSCALTSAETEHSAIISGVACDARCRKTGIGKKTVLSVAESLKKENKDVYVIALNESAEGFYEHIGFEFTEKISFIERK